MATLFQLGSKPDHLPMLPGLPAQHHRAHAGRRAHHHGQRSDYLIAARRRAEQNREQMQHQIQYYDRTQQQSRFEEYTEDSMRRSRVSERFKQLKVEEDGKLEERRERLRQRIAQDEDRYQAELVASRPTKESRVYAMRARVSELKAKREAERQAVVGDKLLQRWRNECDELRVVESKILETEVTNARASQLIEHEQKRALAVQEKQYYDQLWEQDRLKKIEREEKDNQIRRERDLATKLALEEQLKLLRLNAENEERLKQEQGVLMAQEIELQRLAEERAHEQKLQSQRLIRLDLDTFNKNRILARQKEVQEALELDLKIVNAFFRMDEQEREKQSRRKEELKREMKMYMDYLREQRRVEAEREREIEELYAQENAKLWQTRTEKWQREQAARDRLMQEVIAGRKEQLQHSLNLNKARLHEAEIEKQVLEAQVASMQAGEEEARERQYHVGQEYRKALLEQVRVGHERKEKEHQRDWELAEAARLQEERYAELLKREVANAHNLPRVRAFRGSTRDPITMSTIPQYATIIGSGGGRPPLS